MSSPTRDDVAAARRVLASSGPPLNRARWAADVLAQALWAEDLAEVNAELARLGAIMPPQPDGFVGIDPTIAPHALLDLYAGLCSTGYARGWIR